jgi:DNA end-binding protein Ku
MPRTIWTGDISFGLVTIPVEVRPAEEPRELAFHQLDRRDRAPVRQRRVNAATGEEVPWEDVVKGYEYEPGRYVVITDDDLRAANVKATRTIDIVAMVKAEEIPLSYFDKPYFLTPATPAAHKAYAILRETLARSGYIALAYIVIRTRQRVAALVPAGEALMLEILRFPHELRSAADIEFPSADLTALGVTDKEVALAGQLVEAMVEPFDPSKLTDSFRDDVLDLIERKVTTGEVATVPVPAEALPAEGGEVIDMMALLKRSLEAAKGA